MYWESFYFHWEPNLTKNIKYLTGNRIISIPCFVELCKFMQYALKISKLKQQHIPPCRILTFGAQGIL